MLQLGKRGLGGCFGIKHKHTLRLLRETECVLKSQLHGLTPEGLNTSARTGFVPGSWYETACITFTRTKHGRQGQGRLRIVYGPKGLCFGAGKRKG